MDTSSTVVVQASNLVKHALKHEHVLKCKSTKWNSEYDNLLSIWQTFICQVNYLFLTVLCVIDRFLSQFADDNVQLTAAGMFTYLDSLTLLRTLCLKNTSLL